MKDTGSKALLECIKFLESEYDLIDVPFYVDKDVSRFTAPKFKKDYHHGNETSHCVYVASAEQSFLQLIKNGDMINGKYMALTPCIRDEYVSEMSDIKLKVFMKLELISLVESYEKAKVEMNKMLFKMVDFYKSYFDVTIQPLNDNQTDIIAKGIELGSYGINCYKGQYYVYGTGIALPRFNIVYDKGI